MVRKLLSSNNREDFIHQSCRSNRPTGCFSGEAAVPGVATRCQCWLMEKKTPSGPSCCWKLEKFTGLFLGSLLSQKHRQTPEVLPDPHPDVGGAFRSSTFCSTWNTRDRLPASIVPDSETSQLLLG